MLNQNKNAFLLFAVIILFLFLQSCKELTSNNHPFQKGIYDGTIGATHLILVVSNEDSIMFSGFYIHNRKNATEEKKPFLLELKDNRWLFSSEEFNGLLKGNRSWGNKYQGKLVETKNRSFFSFWKNKKNISFTKRKTPKVPSELRYKHILFTTIDVKKDLAYGQAIGYWTETPYLDDPYIEILGKGMINFFKAQKKLDLKLDIYLPVGDTLKKRPLVVLSHGGGFYIGNKQSETEQLLANTFAKRGYVVASIDYRMGFKMNETSIERGAYRTLQDLHAALRYLSHNAVNLGIDPTQVYVAGTSAGAIASLNIAFMDNNERPKTSFKVGRRDDLGTIESSGNKFTDRFEIKAVGNMWGAVTDTSVIDIDEQIPVISFHGTSDNIVPFEYDYPFQNTLMFNRLLANKLYGSKNIHQRLTHLNIENKLIPFIGKGHEPQLDNFKTMNALMDTIKNGLIDFFYEQTIAKVEFPPDALTINTTGTICPLVFDIHDGELMQIEVNGGLQVSDDPKEKSVIWFKDEPVHEAIIYTNNRFRAIGKKTVAIHLSN